MNLPTPQGTQTPALNTLPAAAGQYIDPRTGYTVPVLLKFAPLAAHYELARRLVESPLFAAADRRPTRDLALAIAFACDQPMQMRLDLQAREQQQAATGAASADSLGSMDGGDHAGMRHVTFPNVATRSPSISGVDNPRDIPDDDNAGTGGNLGRRPLLPSEDAGDGVFAVAQTVPGPSPLEHLVARQRFEIERVMPTVSRRSIHDMVTKGQRVPVDLVPAEFRDREGTVISRALKLREGHGRTSLAQNALQQVVGLAGIDPTDITRIPYLDYEEQWKTYQAIHTTLSNARAALLASDDEKVEFNATRGRVVIAPRHTIIAALHGYTIRGDITVAAFEIEPGADLVHSLQRRYESRHTEQARLERGGDLVGRANHVLDDLAAVGVLEPLLPRLGELEAAYATRRPASGEEDGGTAPAAVSAAACTGKDIARWIAAPQARPDWVPLWWLPLACQWIFTRGTKSAKDIWNKHGMLSLTSSKDNPSDRARVAAHLVRRSLPKTAETFDAAANQSVLSGMTGTWSPTARSVANLVDTVSDGGDGAKNALVELQGRTLVAMTAFGALYAATGSQATTRERGPAHRFVTAMLGHKTRVKRMQGLRTAEAAVTTYWDYGGQMPLPRVAEVTPPPGQRWVPTGEPLNDKFVRDTFGKGAQPGSNDQMSVQTLSEAIIEIIEDLQEAVAAMKRQSKRSGEPADAAWKGETQTKLAALIGTLSTL